MKLKPIAASILAMGLASCNMQPAQTSAAEVDEAAFTNALQNTIALAQPLPELTYSTQRQVLVESYLALSKKKPFYMIATNPGAGLEGELPIVATAVVKGCVPATFQLTQPSKILASQHDYGYAIGSQAEINGVYTGPTQATYCIGVDGTFFSIEHLTSFSDRPFSQAIRNQAAVDFTPTLQTKPNGSVVDTSTGETLYDAELGKYTTAE